jgi:hypothetical protein
LNFSTNEHDRRQGSRKILESRDCGAVTNLF